MNSTVLTLLVVVAAYLYYDHIQSVNEARDSRLTKLSRALLNLLPSKNSVASAIGATESVPQSSVAGDTPVSVTEVDSTLSNGGANGVSGDAAVAGLAAIENYANSEPTEYVDYDKVGAEAQSIGFYQENAKERYMNDLALDDNLAIPANPAELNSVIPKDMHDRQGQYLAESGQSAKNSNWLATFDQRTDINTWAGKPIDYETLQPGEHARVTNATLSTQLAPHHRDEQTYRSR